MLVWRVVWSRSLLCCGLVGVLLTSGCVTAPPVQRETKPEPTLTTERRVARKNRIQASVHVDNVELPAALTFAPDGRLFFVEVFAGRVRVVENGVLRPEPVITFQVQQGSESGLLGLALDPGFATNRFVYAYYSEPDPAELDRGVRNRVVRF